MKKTAPWIASCALLLVSMIWGLTFPLINSAIKTVPPSVFVCVRLSLAALVFLPILYQQRRFVTKKLVTSVFWLGLASGLCFFFQTIGLQTTSAANSAFITASSVVMIPFLAPLFGNGRIRKMDIIAALISATGIFILTGGHIASMTRGDLWTLGSALSYALAVNILQKVTKHTTKNSLIVSLQLLWMVPLPLVCAIPHFGQSHWTIIAIIAVLYCSLLSTCLTSYLQARFQKNVSVTRAALIYALEPLFATAFAMLINHAPLTKFIIIGGALLLTSFILSSLYSKSM